MQRKLSPTIQTGYYAEYVARKNATIINNNFSGKELKQRRKIEDVLHTYSREKKKKKRKERETRLNLTAELSIGRYFMRTE